LVPAANTASAPDYSWATASDYLGMFVCAAVPIVVVACILYFLGDRRPPDGHSQDE
jgi:hypothetical protein